MSFLKNSGDRLLTSFAACGIAYGGYCLLAPDANKTPIRAHIGADQYVAILAGEDGAAGLSDFDVSRLCVAVDARSQADWDAWAAATPRPVAGAAARRTHAFVLPAGAFAARVGGEPAERALQEAGDGWTPARAAEAKAAGKEVRALVFRRVRHLGRDDVRQAAATWEHVFGTVLPEAARRGGEAAAAAAADSGGGRDNGLLWSADAAQNERFVTALQVQRPLIEKEVLAAGGASSAVGVQAYFARPTPAMARQALRDMLQLGADFGSGGGEAGAPDRHIVANVDLAEKHMDWALLPFAWEGDEPEAASSE
jgi:hypothetical protein